MTATAAMWMFGGGLVMLAIGSFRLYRGQRLARHWQEVRQDVLLHTDPKLWAALYQERERPWFEQ